VLIALLGAAAAPNSGYRVAPAATVPLERDLATLRKQIRSNLLDRGLLQLALEHNPFDRLPCLGEALPEMRRPDTSPESGADAGTTAAPRRQLHRMLPGGGLPPPLDSRYLSLGGVGRWRGWGWAALAVGGPLLVALINVRTHSQVASLYGLLIVGMVALIRRITRLSSNDVNSLATGILPAAVELELVALLKPGLAKREY